MNVSQWLVNFTVRRRLKKAANKAFQEMMIIENELKSFLMFREYDKSIIFYNCSYCESKGIRVPFSTVEDYSMSDIMVQCDRCKKDIFHKRRFVSYFNNRKIYYNWVNSPLNSLNKKERNSTINGDD
jgi:hypothetical protein